ncbi:hypothetical protein OPT61_g4428 [Boeremia exigua]|uniref:Uncharacterized protein n=1 Tax=Boeremia exigua TaxID=749465 RepID=A0ACC2IE93_9PLEO|nr:hypothetical protein OPT61_g4428 [Boeremia exigua]
MSATTTIQTSTSTSQSKSQRPIHVEHFTSPNAVAGATSTIADAFATDPVTTYLINHLPRSARPAALKKLFYTSNTAAVLAGGELWSASTNTPSTTSMPDFQTAAAIFLPGMSLNILTATSIPRLLFGGGLLSAGWSVGPRQLMRRTGRYEADMAPTKNATFPNGETYFYIHCIGTASAHRGKGLAPALLRKLQERAAKEQRPIYLEASNQHAKRVYEKIGFRDVAGEIRMGKGECDEKGEAARGELAVGVPLWPMIWEPKGYVRGGL